MLNALNQCITGSAYACCDTTYTEEGENKPLQNKVYSSSNLSSGDPTDSRRARRAAQLDLKNQRWDSLFNTSGERCETQNNTAQTLLYPSHSNNPAKNNASDSFVFQNDTLELGTSTNSNTILNLGTQTSPPTLTSSTTNNNRGVASLDLSRLKNSPSSPAIHEELLRSLTPTILSSSSKLGSIDDGIGEGVGRGRMKSCNDIDFMRITGLEMEESGERTEKEKGDALWRATMNFGAAEEGAKGDKEGVGETEGNRGSGSGEREGEQWNNLVEI
ncbi:hypothetical protein TrLO_g1104 [Triparma laevis f. longispina]|uniref:Uncharacterized protein n=1 Tax=Triparma laevis f. longispina TaxID=1714387 RepID=A0A9W7FT09_9STRA|nr:hypothetical protein TrLO_g1104 [Triparma laevis f. longispina]